MLSLFYFLYLLIVVSSVVHDRGKRIKKQLTKCIYGENDFCVDFEDIFTRYLETFCSSNPIYSKENLKSVDRPCRITVTKTVAYDNIYTRALNVLKEHNIYVCFKTLIEYLSTNPSKNDLYVNSLINKFIFLNDLIAENIENADLFLSRITHPQIYSRKTDLRLINVRFTELNTQRISVLTELLKAKIDDEDGRKNIINLLKHLQFFSTEIDSSDPNSFMNAIDRRVVLIKSVRDKIDDIKTEITDIWVLQSEHRSKLLLKFPLSERDFYLTSPTVERFVNAYGMGKKDIVAGSVQSILYQEDGFLKQNHLQTLEDLLKYYFEFTDRQKLKDDALTYITSLSDASTPIPVDSPIAGFVNAYEIDPSVTNFDKLYRRVFDLDVVVSVEELAEIKKKLSTYTNEYYGLFLMIQIDSYIKKNTKIKPIRMYEYISLIINYYNIPKQADMLYSTFIGLIKVKDKTVNLKLTKKIFPYFKNYFDFIKRHEIKKDLIENFETSPESSCLIHSNNLSSFIKEYAVSHRELFPNTLKGYNILENKMEFIDKDLNFYQVQNIHRILVNCYNFTIRKKHREDFKDLHSENPTELRKYFSHVENIVKSYDIKLYDISSFQALERKFINLDRCSNFHEIIKFKEVILQYLKYRQRINAIKSLMDSFAMSNIDCSKARREIETLISEYKINTESLYDVENLFRIILNVDTLVIDKQQEAVQSYLKKCVKIRIRKTYLDRVITKINANARITDFELKRDMAFLTKEYGFIKNPVQNIPTMIQRIKEYDEVFEFENVVSFYEMMQNSLELHKMNESLTDISKYLIDKTEVNFIQMSSNMDRLISVFNLKSQSFASMDDFRTYIQNKQGVSFEYQIGTVWRPLSLYLEYNKRNELRVDITKSLVTTTQRGKFQLSAGINSFTILYGLGSLHAAEYFEFIKKIEKKDYIINLYQLNVIHKELAKHEKYFRNLDTLKTLVPMTETNSATKFFVKDKKFKDIVSAYLTDKIDVDLYKDFAKSVTDTDSVSIESYLKKIFLPVKNYIQRRKVDDEDLI